MATKAVLAGAGLTALVVLAGAYCGEPSRATTSTTGSSPAPSTTRVPVTTALDRARPSPAAASAGTASPPTTDEGGCLARAALPAEGRLYVRRHAESGGACFRLAPVTLALDPGEVVVFVRPPADDLVCGDGRVVRGADGSTLSYAGGSRTTCRTDASGALVLARVDGPAGEAGAAPGGASSDAPGIVVGSPALPGTR